MANNKKTTSTKTSTSTIATISALPNSHFFPTSTPNTITYKNHTINIENKTPQQIAALKAHITIKLNKLQTQTTTNNLIQSLQNEILKLKSQTPTIKKLK